MTGAYLLCGQCMSETIPNNWSVGDCATCQIGSSSSGINSESVRCTPNLGTGSCNGALLGHQQAKVDLENQQPSDRHGIYWFDTVIGCESDTSNPSAYVLDGYETFEACGEEGVRRSLTDGIWTIRWVVLDGSYADVTIAETYHATRTPDGDFEDQQCGGDGYYFDHQCNDFW
jgi:hypothetical protein